MDHSERILFLRGLPEETISPKETAAVLGGEAYAYNIAAKQGKLTLPYIWRGNRLRIFKQPILDLLEGKAS